MVLEYIDHTLVNTNIGTHFMYILNYLRDREVDVPTDDYVRQAIESEATFYGLTELAHLLRDNAASQPFTFLANGHQFSIGEGHTVAVNLSSTKCASMTFGFWINLQTIPIKPRGLVLSTAEGPGNPLPILYYTHNKRLMIGFGIGYWRHEGVGTPPDNISSFPVDIMVDYYITLIVHFTENVVSLWINGMEDRVFQSAVPLELYGFLHLGHNDAFSEANSGICGKMWNLRVHSSALSPVGIAAEMQSTRQLSEDPIVID